MATWRGEPKFHGGAGFGGFVGARSGWQRTALESEHPRLAFNCCRQSGKSTVAALLACHEALYTPGALVLMVSRTLDHSGELFRKALGFYRCLGRPVSPKSETALTLELANGSRIVSRPGASDAAVRGYTASVLVVDEASRVSDELWDAATPVLAVSGGRVITLSTPFGTRGWWYREWIGGLDWQRFEVTADDCPRITPEFLAEERVRKSSREVQQEYYCSWEEAEGQLFSAEVIDKAFVDEVAPLWSDFATEPIYATHQVLASGEIIPTAELLGMRAPVRKPDEIRADLDRALAGNPTYIKRRTALLAELDQALAKEEAESRHGRN